MRYREVKGPPSRFDWNDRTINRLKQCLADGMSASEIGNELGVTRNAVIGKVTRLGLAFSRKPYMRGASLPQQRRTILTLRQHECRWPVGDPLYDPHNFFFCGAAQKEGSSYCSHHDRRSKQ